MDQIDIAHYDSSARRVYWIWIAPFEKIDPLNGPVELAPEKCVNEMTGVEYRHSVSKWLLLRPYCKLGGYFLQLKDDYHYWLVSQGYSYVVDHRWTLGRFGWYVGLHDRAAAAHFKLVHGK